MADAPRNWRRATLRVRAVVRFRLLQRWNRYGLESDVALAQYERLGLLGVGGTAVVYLVRHRETKQLFALKVQPCPLEQPWPRRTFHARRERYILEMLSHPFVCKLHEAFHDSERLYLVLAFEEGGSLDDVRKFCGGALPEEVVKFYASEIVQVLEYLHTMGFVYRDLKPQNVLVARDGHIRLADFGVTHEGLAMHLSNYVEAPWVKDLEPKPELSSDETTTTTASTCSDDQSSDRDDFDEDNQVVLEDDVWSDDLDATPKQCGIDDRVRLRSNSLVGAVEYMPPEMIQQESAQSSDVDWWALGCCMFELLYGISPFHQKGNGSISAIFHRILTGKLEFPPTPSVSSICKDFIRMLLSVDNRERLGHRHGSAEVKAHKFFQNVKWAYRCEKPPVTIRNQCTGCLVRQCSPAPESPPFELDGTAPSDQAWKRWAADRSVFKSTDDCTGCGERYQTTFSLQTRVRNFVRNKSLRLNLFSGMKSSQI